MTANCARCGKQFVQAQPRRGARSKYCSAACRQSNRKPRVKQCERCVNEFSTLENRQKYCSVVCSAKANAARLSELYKGKCKRTETYACKNCGVEFRPKEADRTTYCSRECAYAYVKAHPKPKKPTKKGPFKIVCQVCGKQIEASRPNVSTCSDECKRVDRHMRCYQRRKRYSDANAEPIDFAVVCERDEWTCKLCGKHVDKSIKWPHPMAPSLDHIVQISAGGQHTYANVRLTHLVCNWKRPKVRKNKSIMQNLKVVYETGRGHSEKSFSPNADGFYA